MTMCSVSSCCKLKIILENYLQVFVRFRFFAMKCEVRSFSVCFDSNILKFNPFLQTIMDFYIHAFYYFLKAFNLRIFLPCFLLFYNCLFCFCHKILFMKRAETNFQQLNLFNKVSLLDSALPHNNDFIVPTLSEFCVWNCKHKTETHW